MTTSAERVLVTGAGGFIGSHLTEALVRKGRKVRALVRYNCMHSRGWLADLDASVQSEIEVVFGDIRDAHSMVEAAKGCDVVFHLAALISIPYSYNSPQSFIETNILGTLNLLQAARIQGVRKFIQTSTSEVYGTARFVPITEQHPLQGQSPYSASKIGSDQLALSFLSSYGLPVSVIRPFNTYGPRQSLRAVLPTIIAQASSARSEISLGSLTPTRDFNYVTDTVAGFIAVADSQESIGQVFNVGSNFEISIGDAARLIFDLMKVNITIRQDPNRMRPDQSEVERLWADNTRARNLLRWEPEYAGIEGMRRGLIHTIEWLKNRGHLTQECTAGIHL